MTYDTSRQTLRIGFADNRLIIDDKGRLAQSSYRRKAGTKRLVLQLSGGGFVQKH